MFSVGDTVLYGTQGICTIKEISEMQIGKVKNKYYILVPVYDTKATIYVPTDNQKLVSNMRRLLSPAEINELIDDAAATPMLWVENDPQRKEHCFAVIKSGNRTELMRLISMLYLKREELKNSKKHFHISDERFLRDAEKLLHDEFAYILGINQNEVSDYILNRIKR